MNFNGRILFRILGVIVAVIGCVLIVLGVVLASSSNGVSAFVLGLFGFALLFVAEKIFFFESKKIDVGGC